MILSILTIMITFQNGCSVQKPGSSASSVFFSDIGTFSDSLEILSKGWDYFNAKNYENAKKLFKHLISTGNSEEISNSKSGLGWIYYREGDITSAKKYFNSGISDSISKMGLVTTYLQDDSNLKTNVPDAVNMLNDVIADKNISNLEKTIGISKAQVYALLSYFQALNGDKDRALKNAQTAKTLDENGTRDILDSVNYIVNGTI